MQLFRKKFTSIFITLVITALCFNLSFLLAEVRMPDLRRDIGFIEIIALFTSGPYPEEERDLHANASHEDTTNEIDLLFFIHSHSLGGYVLVCVLRKSSRDHSISLEGNNEIFTPPLWC